MSMSLKAELEVWAAALAAYDAGKFGEALDMFSRIADSSKIYTNMGLIYATVGDHETAVEQFMAATQLDNFLAVAYFQCGVSHFLLEKYHLALNNFEDALLYLRLNRSINYEQLGLKFQLYSAEVLFNRGLSKIYMGDTEQGIADMREAQANRVTDEHNVIDEAIQDRGQGYTVFSIPVGVLYRPPENKLRNTKAKDYLGKAKLVAAADATDAYTTFTGATRLKQGISPQGTFLDNAKPSRASLNRSATILPQPRGMQDPIVPSLRRSKTANVSGSSSSTVTRTPAEGDNSRSTTAQVTTGELMRGQSILRKQTSTPDMKKEGRSAGAGQARMTEFYETYIDSYLDSSPPPPMPVKSVTLTDPPRVEAWVRKNANPSNYAPSRAPSSRGPTPVPQSYGSGSMRRKPTTRSPMGRSGRRSAYDEEEEGYASGDYDDSPAMYELSRIRVKVYYKEDVRGLTLTPDVRYEELLGMLSSKFTVPANSLDIKFKDEDGVKVSLKDRMDYELALETARENAQGKPEGRLEIWCAEL